MKKIILLFIFIFTYIGVNAQYTKWVGSVSADWDTAANWSNGVPTSAGTAEVSWINSNNYQPVLSTNTTVNQLTLGSNNQTLSIVNGAVLNVSTTLSIGNSGTLDVGTGIVIVNDFSTIQGTLNVGTGSIQFIGGVTLNNVATNLYGGQFIVGQAGGSSVSFNITGQSKFNLNNSDLIIYGPAVFDGSAVVDAGTGNIEIYGDSQFSGNLTFDLNQADLVIDGSSVFNGSAVFDAGTGDIEIHGDSEFSGGSTFDLEQADIEFHGETVFKSSFDANEGDLTFHDDIVFDWGGGTFDPGESTTILDGDITIGNNNNGQYGQTGSFNDVVITEGSDVTGDLPLNVTGNFTNNGDYNHLTGTHLDIYGEIIGYEDMTTDFPFVMYVNLISSTSIEVVFSEAILTNSLSNLSASNTFIRDGYSNSPSVLSSLSSANLKSGTNNVVVLNFATPIELDSTSNYLWIETTVEDVDNNSIRNPYIKQLQVANEIYWVGTNSSNWKNASNWDDVTGILDGTFPNPLGGYDLKFADNAVRDLILLEDIEIENYENFSTKDLELNGFSMSVSENMSVSNTYIWGDSEGSELILSGEQNQTIPSNIFENNTLHSLTINNNEEVILEGELNLTGVLSLDNGVLVTQDNLTLKSYLNNTAIVAPVTNGSILGDVTVERYIPAKRAFRFVTSSVTTTTSIHENWQEGANNTGLDRSDNLNPNPGFGAHITGSTIGANGLDATPSGNPSLFKYNSDTQTYEAITNTFNETIQAGVAYSMMIRGDRSIDVTNNDAVAEATILRAKGELMTGNYYYSGAQVPATGGFELIGNPYQAAIDGEDLLQSSNGVNQQFVYVWDPTQNTRGAYVTVDVNSNANNLSSSTANKYIQPWQAVFVEVNPSQTPSFKVEESFKSETTTTTTTYSVAENDNSLLQVTLFERDAYLNGGNAADGFVINFSSEFSNEVDNHDAIKFDNQDEMLAINKNGNLLSIENRGQIEKGDEIEFYSSKYRFSDYIYIINVPNFEGFTAYLEDSYLKKTIQLKEGGENFISFQVDINIDESIASDRFKINFAVDSTLNVEDFDLNNNFVIYPNPTNTGYFNIGLSNVNNDVTIEVFSLLGQKVYETNDTMVNGKLTLSTSEFSTGVYLVKMTADGVSYTKKLIVE
ncbi:Por secretion system C-terminal sorting domain-containing protein [Mesonia phycicola]|uniref:Por secretion system C-terminal sorting domain-containing protein n=1 Tax=Mesonia phycicola TaxID=579105 RepID=A0A1M6AL94_9FLAO|nr:T9SS type A sorting domain-containing protein [Mesonia phycicola]SHI37187.1 Por secretion system C-terminal sorting domain-containing protein [Mesonia phycicola]